MYGCQYVVHGVGAGLASCGRRTPTLGRGPSSQHFSLGSSRTCQNYHPGAAHQGQLAVSLPVFVQMLSAQYATTKMATSLCLTLPVQGFVLSELPRVFAPTLGNGKSFGVRV